jgi:hypothetical protein
MKKERKDMFDMKAYQKKWHKDNESYNRNYYKRKPKIFREANWRHAGINFTWEKYEILKQQQNFACAICLTPETKLSKSLELDHDHTTGLVRGLLCHSCNLVLGKIKDSKHWLRNAIQYVS